MEVSFDEIGHDLSAGRIVGYNIVTDFGDEMFNMRKEQTMGNNKLMEFRYADGTTKRALVQLRGQDIFAPQVNLEYHNFMEPEEIQQLRVVKTINQLSNESKARYNIDPIVAINNYFVVSALMWASGTSFDDLQAMNILFLRGLLPFTPEHGGAIFEETQTILPQLIQMNKDGMITTDSQPFEEAMAIIYNPPVPYRQKPYVHFFVANNKVESIILGLLERDPNIGMAVHRLDNDQYRVIGNPNPVANQEYRNGRWVDADAMTLQKKSIDREYYIGMYGDSFRPLLSTMTLMQVYSSEFNNDLFVYMNEIGFGLN